MSPLEIAGLVALVLAAVPAALTAWNLVLYRLPPRPDAGAPTPRVSLLIPARDEATTIGGALDAALASRGVELEVLVLDDRSRDRTAAVVRARMNRDPRLRLLTSPPLPAGWNGKQRACALLADTARHPILVFADADVRLAPDGLARAAAALERSGADLASGVPRQTTGSFLEKAVIPLIHFVLLGYLPLIGMRWSRRPAFAAGCGQLFVARRAAYRRAGGHAAIRASRHDGLALPRAFRRAGLRTDLFDATALASCRMYRSAGALWRGLAKNADEGMAAPGALLPWSALLLGGHVLPALLVAVAWAGGAPVPASATAALGLGIGTRLVLALRFEQSIAGALVHPFGVAVLVAIQWYARWRTLRGRPIPWKGRVAA